MRVNKKIFSGTVRAQGGVESSLDSGASTDTGVSKIAWRGYSGDDRNVAAVPEAGSDTQTPVIVGGAVGYGALGEIESRVDAQLAPLAEKMSKHWSFLYARADPDSPASAPGQPGVSFSNNRKALTGRGIEAGLQLLAEKGHVPGSGRALVMGGGYEVNLEPLLNRFQEVVVADLTQESLELARRKYASHEGASKLRLVQADLSGLPVHLQRSEMNRLKEETANGSTPRTEGIQEFFGHIPAELEPLRFESGEFQMVVSPVLHEGLAYGPAVYGVEAGREHAGTDRKSIDSVVGEPFFYDSRVMQGFANVFQHHSDELQRLLSPDGVAVFGSWMRPDEKQPDDGTPRLLRVGDTRATPETWSRFFASWGVTHEVCKEMPHQPVNQSVMNVFVLEPRAA
jgi:hypothetical protein